MPDYIAIVEVDDGNENSPIREMLYLVDRESYYLLGAIQKSRPTKETLKVILDWLVENKKAVQLQHRPNQLWFSPERNNMRVDEA